MLGDFIERENGKRLGFLESFDHLLFGHRAIVDLNVSDLTGEEFAVTGIADMDFTVADKVELLVGPLADVFGLVFIIEEKFFLVFVVGDGDIGVLVERRAEIQHHKLLTFAEGQALCGVDFEGPAAFFRVTEDRDFVPFHAIGVEFHKQRETLQGLEETGLIKI